MSRSKTRRDGSVTIYLIFSFFLLIPVAGLAVDFSVLYSVKAKLQTAVDAAAIGSGNTLNRGAVMDSAAVRNVAQRFFDANYPAGYLGTTAVSYTCDPVQGALGIRTVTVNASQRVPMLLLRVLGISNSTVAAMSQVTVRFVNMMLVIDRSGSVNTATFGSPPVNTKDIVKADLRAFVDPSDGSNSPFFSDGRDYIGMISFGTSWRRDFALSPNFQTATPDIGKAIDNLDWANNSTNTADGLFHAYRELQTLNQPGALNVIVLLTDGRPSAFSGTFPLKAGSSCTDKSARVGVLMATVDQGWLPPLVGKTRGVYKSTWTGYGLDGTLVSPAKCAYETNVENMNLDIANFPASVSPPEDNPAGLSFLTTATTNGDMSNFTGAGNNIASARAIRYAAFNVADNVATKIRTDVTISPVIFVIGLNNSSGEPLDADWLARVANDPDYVDALGNHVYHAGQTAGKYFNVTADGIEDALRQIASQILRFTK